MSEIAIIVAATLAGFFAIKKFKGKSKCDKCTQVDLDVEFKNVPSQAPIDPAHFENKPNTDRSR